MQLNAVSAQLQVPHLLPPAQLRPPVPVQEAASVSEKDKAPETTPQTSDKKPGAFAVDTFLRHSRSVGLAAGGGFAAYRLGDTIAKQMREIGRVLEGRPNEGLTPVAPNLQKLAASGMQGAGLSAMVAGGVSVIANGIAVVRGNIEGQTAVQNIISDSLSGAISGFSAVSAAGAGNLLLSSMGVIGLPLTVATVAFGAAGSVLSGRLVGHLHSQSIADEAAAEAAATEEEATAA